VGRKLGADPVVRGGTGLQVLAPPGFKSFLEILADRAIHGYPFSPPADARMAVELGFTYPD
jgi:hypothetical protein